MSKACQSTPNCYHALATRRVSPLATSPLPRDFCHQERTPIFLWEQTFKSDFLAIFRLLSNYIEISLIFDPEFNDFFQNFTFLPICTDFQNRYIFYQIHNIFSNFRQIFTFKIYFIQNTFFDAILLLQIIQMEYFFLIKNLLINQSLNTSTARQVIAFAFFRWKKLHLCSVFLFKKNPDNFTIKIWKISMGQAFKILSTTANWLRRKKNHFWCLSLNYCYLQI